MRTGPEQVTRAARRKGAILYCAHTHLSETEHLLAALAMSVRSSFFPSHSGTAFWEDLEREKDSLSLAVLEGHLGNVVALARQVAAVSSMAEIVLLTTDEERRSLQEQLGPAPRLGMHWQFVSPQDSGLARSLQICYQRADQRRSTRTTLDRFNARLSPAVDSVDTQQLRQLVISDRFLSSVLESAFDAVLMIDRSGLIAAFNPSAERLFGRTQRQAISHPVASLASGAWQNDIATVLGGVAQGELLQSSFMHEELEKFVEISATPVFDTAKNRIATSLIVRDITQRLQSENALRTTEKLAAVGRLASSIAHEINNPLEAVTNLLYLARSTAINPETQSYLEQADQELRRMSVITAQTLRFHKQAAKPKVVTAEELLETVLVVYQARFVNSQVHLEKKWNAREPVCCFEGEIRQVLNNLVGNALDAMHGSGGRLLLRSRDGFDWKTGTRGMTLTIADTGSGMSPKTASKIFEPFYTTKGMLGTGLGLWISSEIVAQHRGQLRVRSKQLPGRAGTVFTLFLPCNAAVR